MVSFNASKLEQKWQQKWAEADSFATTNNSDRPKYYVLEMFPYPSGRIHMGHVRNYALGDVVARYKKAKGLMFCIRWAGRRLACRQKLRQ